MLVLLPILTATLTQPATADYTVVSVDRQEAFAGKLGRRVSQTIVAEKDGKRFEIKFVNHTAIRGSVKNFAAGDTIKADSFTFVKEAK